MTTDVAIKGAHRGHKKNRYHTDPDCRHYPTDPEFLPRRDAEDRGMSECGFCSGEADTGGSTDPWKYHRLAQTDD